MNITKREGMMCCSCGQHNTTRRARTLRLFVHILDIKAYHGIRARARRAANEIYCISILLHSDMYYWQRSKLSRQHKPATRHYRFGYLCISWTSKHIMAFELELDELPMKYTVFSILLHSDMYYWQRSKLSRQHKPATRH
jgi:hypothetical protein